MARCKSCKAEVLYAETANARRMPLNATPVDDGEWVIIGGRCRRFVPGEDDGRKRYRPHWADCPDAPLFRSAR